MEIKKKFVKDTLSLSVSTGISDFIGLLRGIVIAKFLGPSLYGIWQTLSLILNYGQYSELGLFRALEREVPYQVGKGNKQEASLISKTVFTSTLALSAILAAVLLIYSIFPSFSPTVLWGIRIVAVLVILQQAYLFLVYYLRSNKHFKTLSLLITLFAVSNFIALLLMIERYNIFGALFSLTIAYSLCGLFVMIKEKPQISLLINVQKTKELLKIGLPLLIFAFGTVLLNSVDRFLVIFLLGSSALGFYGIGIMIITFISHIPAVITNVTYPHLLENYGAHEDIQKLKGFLEKPTYLIAGVMPIFIGASYLVLPLLINTFLPAYIPGIPAILILLIVSFFNTIAMVATYFIIAIRKHKLLIKVQTIVIIILVILDYFLITNGYGLAHIAAVYGFTHFLYSLAVLYYALSQCTTKILERGIILLKFHMPYLLVLAVLAVSFIYSLSTAATLLLLLASFGVIAVYLDRHTKIISALIPEYVQMSRGESKVL